LGTGKPRERSQAAAFFASFCGLLRISVHFRDAIGFGIVFANGVAGKILRQQIEINDWARL
jgi:hypothetical protein